MPALIWIAIAIAIVIMGIGGSVALPQVPESVIKPMAEKGLDIFSPALRGIFIAAATATCVYVFMKFKTKGS